MVRIWGRLASSRPLFPAPVYLVCPILLIVASFLYTARHNSSQIEIDQYVPHYLSREALFAKIFAFDKVESPPVYRPRPLSYIVDNYDVAFIGWSARVGYPHLLSVSYYCFKVLDCLFLFYLLRSGFGLTSALSLLLISLLLTTPSMAIGGAFFRSAKPGSLFFSILAFSLILNLYRAGFVGKPALERIAIACLAIGALLTACLFDEIPAALTLAASVVGLVAYFSSSRSDARRSISVCLGVAAIVLSLFNVYNFFIQPRMILAATGKVADMTYQQGTARALLQDLPSHTLGALGVLLDAFGFVFGNLPPLAMIILISASLVSIWKKYRQRVPIIISFVLLWACLWGMVSRHPAIMSLSVRRANYVEPFELAFLLFAAATLTYSLRQQRMTIRAGEICLWTLLLSNIVRLPTNVGIMFIEDSLDESSSSSVLTALRSGTSAFDAETRKEILANPLYRALHEQMRLGGTAKE